MSSGERGSGPAIVVDGQVVLPGQVVEVSPGVPDAGGTGQGETARKMSRNWTTATRMMSRWALPWGGKGAEGARLTRTAVCGTLPYPLLRDVCECRAGGLPGWAGYPC